MGLNITNIIIYSIVIIGLNDCLAQRNNRLSNNIKKDNRLQIKYSNDVAEFQKMIEFENVSAINLYRMINRWAIDSFNSSSDVIVKNEDELIQVEGVQPGILLQMFPRNTACLKYKFNIEIEDNKVCITMCNMEVLTESNKYSLESYIYKKNGNEISDKRARNVKAHAIKVANVLINALETFFIENGVERKW